MLRQSLKVWRQHRDQAQRESGKGYIRQLWEIGRWRVRGFGALEYYVYPLYQGCPGRRVTTRKYDALQRRLNPPATGVIGADKWVQAAIWSAHGISHARVLGYTRNGYGMLEGKPFTGQAGEVSRFLEAAVYPLVAKPLDGANGRGFDIIQSFSPVNQAVIFKRAGKVTLAEFQRSYIDAPQGTLFQEHVNQHPALSAIYPASLNTVRVITHRVQNRCLVRQAMIKFGSDGEIIDNDVDKGVIAGIDLETGRLQRVVRRIGTQVLREHPDTGCVFSEVTIPCWEKVKKLAVDAHYALPGPGYLGWDIAIAADGPLVIEVNAYLSVAVNQKVSGHIAEGLLGD